MKGTESAIVIVVRNGGKGFTNDTQNINFLLIRRQSIVWNNPLLGAKLRRGLYKISTRSDSLIATMELTKVTHQVLDPDLLNMWVIFLELISEPKKSKVCMRAR